jgi:hypothetical protein
MSIIFQVYPKSALAVVEWQDKGKLIEIRDKWGPTLRGEERKIDRSNKIDLKKFKW